MNLADVLSKATYIALNVHISLVKPLTSLLLASCSTVATGKQFI